MPTTYKPLASTTLTNATSSVTISDISQSYTDLVLIINAQSTTANTYDNVIIRFNSDTGSNYSRQRLNAFSGGANAERNNNATSHLIGPITGTSFSSSIFSQSITQIQNYSNTTVFKTALWRSGSQSDYVQLAAGLWRNTNAITSIDIRTLSGDNLAAGSTFSLYGIASAAVVSEAKATGGDTITTDGTYWYHAFRSSGTFTPSSTLSCDVLVIAGGGGGGGYCGGGGAGGVAYQTSRSVSSASTVTIGGGGAIGAPYANGVNGGNSVFDNITANGGGGGAGLSVAGSNGGSGGGAGNAGTAGTSTQGSSGGATGYGFAGGTGTTGPTLGGGGGGAGAVGSNAVGSTVMGNGGNGLNTWSTWATVTGTGASGYYAGGGGGGADGGSDTASTGGLGGGGGAFAGTVTAVAGTAYTGGGGGGGFSNATNWANSGGSGLVIVRYPV